MNLFPRQCTITGKGFSEGFLVGDESTFFEAFVQRNKLYSDAEPEEKELTEEELKRIKRVLSLAEQLEENHYHKQLDK